MELEINTNNIKEPLVLESKMKWYALSVVSNKERSIKENILKKVSIYKLDKYLSRVEIPMEKYLSVRNGNKVVKERVLMPGYLLICADLSHGELQPFLKGISGIFGFLSTIENKVVSQPIPLKDREVKTFLHDENDTTDKKETNISWLYSIGDKVKLLEGSFASFVGMITEINDSKKTLKICVNIFSRETLIEIEYTCVEKIKDI